MPIDVRRVVTGHDRNGRVTEDKRLPVSGRVGVWFTGPGSREPLSLVAPEGFSRCVVSFLQSRP